MAVRFLALFLLVWSGGSVPWCWGDGGWACDICGERSPGRMFLMNNRAQTRQVVACERCSRLPERCTTCRLPVFRNYTTLGDGRYLCEQDAAVAVLDPDTARTIFNQVQGELFSLFSGLGVLPDRNLRVKLVDQKELSRLFSGTPGAHPDGSLQGLTRSRRFSKDTFEHEIFLCSGLSRERLAAVAAHEFTHAWIQENVPRDRTVDSDVEEAFCELAAFQIMQRRGQEFECRMILENAYTRGKIDVLVRASDSYQFHRVAEWMKSGRDTNLEADRTDRVIALKDPPQAFFGFSEVVHARAPDVLTLKGLSGRASRRFALINDTTLCAGEQARVRVAATNVLVRCEEIRDHSVVIHVDGVSAPVELQLDARPGAR